MLRVLNARLNLIWKEVVSKSGAKEIMEPIEITPEMAEWMNEILSPYMVPLEDMEVN